MFNTLVEIANLVTVVSLAFAFTVLVSMIVVTGGISYLSAILLQVACFGY